MNAEEFREIALAQQGAEERAHMGHPDFRANGRIFASLHAGDRTGMVKVDPEEQAVLLREHPKVFAPAAGAWGRQGCTVVTLSEATRRVLSPAMLLAWEAVMKKGRSRARTSRR